MSVSQTRSTVTQQVTSFVTVPSRTSSTAISTATFVGAPDIVSSEDPTSVAASTEPASTGAPHTEAASTEVLSTEAATASPKPATESSETQTATGLDVASSSTSYTSDSAHPSSSTPSALAAHNSKSAPSTSVIAGIAVGSVALISFIAFIAFLLFRYLRRRRQATYPAHQPLPSPYEPNKGDHLQEKPWPNRHNPMLHAHAPVGCAELDGGSPVSPVWEPVELGTRERKASVAQNF